MSTFTKEQLSDDCLVKILSETQAEVTEHNSRCARGSVEVDARMFESMLVEIQLRRHLMEQQAAMLQGAENAESRCTIQAAPALDSSPKNAESRCSNSPVIPDGWVACSERMPEESGRYWCYVEEQNDLGKSHYQWNCSWNGDRWWVESENGGRVTHWQPLPSPPEK